MILSSEDWQAKALEKTKTEVKMIQLPSLALNQLHHHKNERKPHTRRKMDSAPLRSSKCPNLCVHMHQIYTELWKPPIMA